MTTKSSQRWLKEHFSDSYVKKAQECGYRSRAAFKLLEIQQKDALFKPGMRVIELGAAPGSWSQLLAQWIIKPARGHASNVISQSKRMGIDVINGTQLIQEPLLQGQIIAVDLLPMTEIAQVEFIQGDFTDDEIISRINSHLNNHTVDWIVSDMAPNMSGNASIDIPRMMYLAETVLEYSITMLNQKGGLLIKLFQGEGLDAFMQALRQNFQKVFIRKPKASRNRSRELYVIAQVRKM